MSTQSTPGKFAQATTLADLERQGVIVTETDRMLAAGAQDIRIRMEFSEDPLVHRVNAIFANVTTIEQPAGHGYTIEDMKEHPFSERDPCDGTAYLSSKMLRTMKQAMKETEGEEALIQAATDHFSSFEKQRSNALLF